MTPIIRRNIWMLCAGIAALCCVAGCAPSLHDTVARGDVARVQAMLERNPQLAHARGHLDKTPLHYAVTYKQPECMELLLRHGADINAADYTGMTPLHAAAMLGRKDEAEWLLERGAALETRDIFGDTPLLTAAVFGNGHLVELFWRRGADLNARNNDGRNALELARHYRRERAENFIARLMARQQ